VCVFDAIVAFLADVVPAVCS